MGGLFSKSSKSSKSKDPKWQGIGPNTPIPSSSNVNLINSNGFNQPQSSNYPRYGALNQQQQQSTQSRSQTSSKLDNQATNPNNARNSKPAAAGGAKANKSSKIMLLLKMDPKTGQRKIIAKNLISLPSDFRHTGHIGAGEVRSGQIDTDKIKNQMMEVAACLKLDVNTPMPMLKTMPIQPENRENVYTGPDQMDRYATRPGAEAAAF
ncbi:hypothetical protein BGZ99_009153 [Dissophora globulifera]|uniref:CRIB domain-containing protein n=1 Tax=Dissophora globulifera TaxID=979702 RepID=A0A9P6UNT0_9FUNG|nr:hypothetical protein BGZ99_009153 [Dissophora globulifera]